MTRSAAGQAPAQAWPVDGLERVERCPVCGDTRRTVLYDGLRDRVFFCAPGEWTLHECAACGSAYLDPRPTEDTIALAYSTYFTHQVSQRPGLDRMGALRRVQRSLANGYRNWRYGTRDTPASPLGPALAYLLPRHRALMDSELRHLPPGAGRVLDIGCGDGAFLEWARAAGWEGIGVDPDPGAVASARSRGLDVRLGDARVLVDERASFDAVTLSHVLEHVHDPEALLKQIRELLKPGGLLWLDTPNVASTGHRLFGRSWRGLEPPRHLVLFTPSSLRQILAAARLTLVRTIPRFEVCDRMFAASDRIARGQDPTGEPRAPFGVRMRARAAGALARARPGTSEFLTVVAARET